MLGFPDLNPDSPQRQKREGLHKEYAMKKTTCYTIFTTVMTTATAMLLTACVMDTDDTYDVEPVPAEELTTESIAVESDDIVDEIAEMELEEVAPTPTIVVEPTEIKIDLSKKKSNRSLKVGVDHQSADIEIYQAGEFIDVQTAKDCEKDDRDEFYRICEFVLDPGVYTVRFGSIAGYETPDEIDDVNLKWGDTEAYGSYAEDPEAPRPRQADVRLYGIGDHLAF